MGDDAWLWKLECEFRKFNYVGDTQWLRGHVVRKYLADGDRPAVDLELTAENQRGEVTTPGTRRSCSRAVSTARSGSRTRPAARATSARARRDLGRVLAPMTDFAGTGADGLVVTLEDGVLHLTLDRPEKRNAIADVHDGRPDRRGERSRRPTSACA